MADHVLSIFIDESGDFGKYEQHSGRYIVSLVFHDQKDDIRSNISVFQDHLKQLGYTNHAVHTGPLIRREQFYEFDLVEKRKRLFNSLFNCARKLPISYACVDVNKLDRKSEVDLAIRIAKQLGAILDSQDTYLRSFERINIYYDNGQSDLTKIISSVFGSRYNNVEIRKVQPADYLLFQIADLFCTMELLSEKAEQKKFSKSEMEFFDNIRNFKKNYLKWILRKHI